MKINIIDYHIDLLTGMELLCRLADTQQRVRRAAARWRRKGRREDSLLSLCEETESGLVDSGDCEVEAVCDDESKDNQLDENNNNHNVSEEDESEDGICWATANVDCIPSPYDRDSLAFKEGGSKYLVIRIQDITNPLHYFQAT